MLSPYIFIDTGISPACVPCAVYYLARFMPEMANSPSREARVTTPSP